MTFYSICPLCKKRTESNLFGLQNYNFCPYCKLAWLKKFPKTIYNDIYYKGTSNIFSLLFSLLSRFFYFLRKRYVEKKHIGLWIDVGAGDGEFLKTVNAKKKIGVEISLAGRTIMKKNKLNVLSNKEFLKITNLKADIISYWHVLEHVNKPWNYLKAGSTNLSKGGRIIIGIPNIDSFEFLYFRKYWFHLAPQYHLWQFSTQSILFLLSQNGFKIETIDYWSFEHHLTGVLQSFINMTAGSDNVLHRLVKRGLNYSPDPNDIFWSIFWLTLGFPLVFFFWIMASLFHKSGTIVIVVKKQSKNR